MFTNNWTIVKETSPKLEFYNLIKTKHGLEDYLLAISNHEHRANVTRLRISSHNLFVERGRYEIPLVPRHLRYCLHCKHTDDLTLVENEIHVLTVCPLYNWCRKFYPENISLESIKDLFCGPKTDGGLKKFGNLTNSILEANKHFLKYYQTQDFHTNTGACKIL